jgi:hypothetical protein
MKLQFLTNLSLQQQELNNIKGGKRICINMPPKLQLAIANAIPKVTVVTSNTHVMIGKTDILIEWKSFPCKKP